MTPKARALAVVQRVAEAKGLCPTDILSRSRVPLHDKVRVQAYHALRTELEWPYASIGRLFDRDKSVVRRTVLRLVSQPPKPDDIYDLYDDSQRQLRRLSGVDLAKKLAAGIDLKLWQATFLAIVIEAYPRSLTRDQMCELYDHAMALAGGGRARDGVSDSMCKAAISRVNAAFDDRGLNRPFETRPSIGVSLSPKMAPWFSSNYGRPFILQAVT